MKRLSHILIGISFLFGFGAFSFVGKDSTEAILTFSHFLDTESQEKPRWNNIKEQVEDQLLFLFGPMSVAKYYAAPKGEHKLRFQNMEQIGPHLYRFYYDYEGTIQLKKGPIKYYELVLPRRNTKEFIYDPGISAQSRLNKCTDDHYNSFDDFWYFWNPQMRGCPLKKGFHYDTIRGNIRRIKNSPKSYPEYNRLINPDSGDIPIFVFFGLDETARFTAPNESEDESAKGYVVFKKLLLKLGFQPEAISDDEVESILQGHRFRAFFVERLVKQLPLANMKITLFFGPTGMDESSGAFHYFYKEASESAALLIYDGHSGLGSRLNPRGIEELRGFKIKQNPQRYQIFFFNSCSSYTYYNTLYFYRKAKNNIRLRTKSIDILTNGLSTEFDRTQKTNLALIRAVQRWSSGQVPPSYQTLVKYMDQRNLFSVNGDEDNPTIWESSD